MRGTTRGAVIPVEQCWKLAERWYRDRLDPNWHPKTAEEIEQIFNAVNLTAPFWSVR